MNRKVYFLIVVGHGIAFTLIVYGILNTMVSMKYELSDLSECISNISGIDLCHQLQKLQTILIVTVLSIFTLLLFKKKIVNR